MKLPASILCLTFTLAAAPSSPVRKVEIDPLKMVPVPVSAENLTTIQFPSPISDIEGVFISSDGEPPSKFQISFRPGSHFFSLRAVSANAAATVNVVWKGRIHIFALVESTDPVLSLIMLEPASTNAATMPRSAGIAPARLQEIMRMAMLYPSIQRTNPELLTEIERVSPHRTVHHTHFASTLEEVYGFASDDTLVFRLSFTNKTPSPILYLPKTLMAKAGERRFLQSFVDADGVIATNSSSIAYFAITGGVKGTPKGISITNQFEILLETVPVTANPLPVLSPTTPTTPTNSATIVPPAVLPSLPACPPSVAVPAPGTNSAQTVLAGPLSITAQAANPTPNPVTNQIATLPVAAATIAEPPRVLTLPPVSVGPSEMQPASATRTNRANGPSVILPHPAVPPSSVTPLPAATIRPVFVAPPTSTIAPANPPPTIILIAPPPASYPSRMNPAPIIYEEEDYVERKPWWHFSRWSLIHVTYHE